MKLLLIQAWNAGEHSLRSKFSNLICYSSLTLASIYALIPPGMFECIDIVDEYSQTVDYDRKRYDLVMISSDTSAVLTAYKHSHMFHKRGAYTVIGGYHATALPDEVRRHCNTVIKGPAELAIPAFLRDFANGCPKSVYEDRHTCAADFPVPVRGVITGKRKLRIPAVIANRGCINACRYCSMPVMHKNDARPVDQVIAEIESLHTKFLIFYDPNFFANREYAIRLMRRLKPLRIYWVCNATADLGYDHELMQLAFECGLRGVLIGFESLDSENLRQVRKRFSDAGKYKEIVDNLHSHGIAVNGCFVMGFDDDTAEKLRNLPRQVDALGLDLCRFAILTPYPGTAIYKQFEREGRITSKDWKLYNQHHVVFAPKQIRPVELHRIYREVWAECYHWDRIFRRVVHSPSLHTVAGIFLIGANLGFRHIGIDT